MTPQTELAADFVSRTIESERTYLASLWLDGFEGTNAACDAGLCGADFILPPHAFVFDYVCISAERNLKTSVADCVVEAAFSGVQLFEVRPFPYTDGRLFLYCDILEPHLAEVREGSCLFYAQAVKAYGDQRREAQEAFRKYRQILSTNIPLKQRIARVA